MVRLANPIRLLFTFLLSGAAFAQSGQNPFQPGILIDTVHCLKSPGQSYALYLPSAYTTNRTWPVVYLFDPAARGTLPLKHFRQAAETFGYILICSNNSRNGDWEVSFNAAEAVSKDAQERFAINPKRLYTGGFSGGSRAASAIAVLSGQIAGVIGCGAGFSGLSEHQPPAKAPFVYAGIVGDKDMNYQEMLQVEKQLASLHIARKLFSFDGGHEWPPSERVVEAFGWLELQAMKQGLLVKRTDWIDSLYQQAFRQAQQCETKGQLYDAWLTYQQLAADFTDLHDLAEPNREVIRLSGLKEIDRGRKAKQKIGEKERALQREYRDAFRTAIASRFAANRDSLNETWWRNEVRSLTKLQKSEDSAEQLMGKRLIDMLWRMCAEQGGNYLSNQDFKAAEISYRLWILVEPDAPRPYFSLALAYASEQKGNECLINLEKAVEKGFTQANLIETNPVFNAYRQENRYKKLMEKLKQAAKQED